MAQIIFTALLWIIVFRILQFYKIFCKWELPVIFPDVILLLIGIDDIEDYKKSWMPCHLWPNASHNTKDVPDGFYDFTNGCNISKERVDEWIEKSNNYVKSELINGKKSSFTSCRSGNTMVMCEGHEDEYGNHIICTYISKSYWEKMDVIKKSELNA